MNQQHTPIVPESIAKPLKRRASNGSEGAFDGSKWNLYLEWRLLHRRDLTERGSALLDAIARMLLGYKKSRGEIGRRLLMEMTGIDDPRDFNRVRDELKVLGLVVTHEGRGAGTRTTYSLGLLLSEAFEAWENRRLYGRLSPLPKSPSIDGPPAVVIDGPPATETTAPEPPRMETSSTRDAVGVPGKDSFGVGRDESSDDASSRLPAHDDLTQITVAHESATLAPTVARVDRPDETDSLERAQAIEDRQAQPWDTSEMQS